MKDLLATGLSLLSLLLCLPQTWPLDGIRGLKSLTSGSFLSVEAEEDLLISPNRSFSGGFYKVGDNAYCFSIWFTNSENRTVVWMANRDRPVNGRLSKLTLLKSGNLVLTDADGSTIWQTSSFSQEVLQAVLLETGNLVLLNNKGEMIWESFDFATDTLLPLQRFTKNMTLVSKRGPGNNLSGLYKLHFSDNNILTLLYDGPLISSAYLPEVDVSIFNTGRNPYNSSRVALLDEMGVFKSSDSFRFIAADAGKGPKRRLTLEYDGGLRLYSLVEPQGVWKVSYILPLPACTVHGLCGSYGFCRYNPSPTCECPPGFSMTDPVDWSKGCSPNLTLSCDPDMTDFVELPNTDYFGFDRVNWGLKLSFESCKNACLSGGCQCRGFVYSSGDGACFPKSKLLNGYQMAGNSKSTFVRVLKGAVRHGGSSPSTLLCGEGNLVLKIGGEASHKNGYPMYLIAFVGAIGLVEMVCIGLGWWYMYQRHEHQEATHNGYLALALGFKRFSYHELKKATRNFELEIGKGGFGAVYKGVLDENKVVAVKKLEGFEQGEAEFWAEVSIIGRLNHINLVKVWGFCAEEKHKLLVYEYMENGSLDKILFSDSPDSLSWEKRFQIAFGTARGLSYLHEECLEWVLHCDIKPQNILLDEKLQPKLSDFGLCKLVQKKENSKPSFSRVRGTRGYLAPEWIMNQDINAKADVYSFGIVLLELVSGKSVVSFKSEPRDNNEGSNDLVQWVRDNMSSNGGGVKELIDPRLDGNYNGAEAEKLVQVALLCVREDKEKRPVMSEVVNLLLRDCRNDEGDHREEVDVEGVSEEHLDERIGQKAQLAEYGFDRD